MMDCKQIVEFCEGVVFFFLGSLSSLGLVGVSIRALIYGDGLVIGGLVLWTLIAACIYTAAFLAPGLSYAVHLCRSKDVKLNKNAGDRVHTALAITLLAITLALYTGISYKLIDSNSIDQLNSNFPENFYQFAGTEADLGLLAAYTKFQAIWIITLFTSVIQFKESIVIYVKMSN